MWASRKSSDEIKKSGVMSRTADQRVSILKWCFWVCLLSPFKFKIMRYLPLFFFLTKTEEMYSSGQCTAGSLTPSSSRWTISELMISFTFESNWISGLVLGLDCQSPGANSVQWTVYFCLLWDSSMLNPNALAYQKKKTTKQQQQQKKQKRKTKQNNNRTDYVVN